MSYVLSGETIYVLSVPPQRLCVCAALRTWVNGCQVLRLIFNSYCQGYCQTWNQWIFQDFACSQVFKVLAES